MGPLAHSDGHDLQWSVDEVVPGIEAECDDFVVGLQEAVRELVVAHELPDCGPIQIGRLTLDLAKLLSAWVPF
jgi:hypothetical protein